MSLLLTLLHYGLLFGPLSALPSYSFPQSPPVRPSEAVAVQSLSVPRTHFRPQNGWIGDLHPLFHQGKWSLYGLQISKEPLRAGLSRLHSVELASSDLLRWKPHRIVHQGTLRDWWAIANIRAEGKWFSFYNGAKGFDLSLSNDGTHWTAVANNPVVPYPSAGGLPELAECRDPYVFRDPASGRYYLIVAGKKKQASAPHLGGIFLFATSQNLRDWSRLRVLYDPGDIGIPECPEMFEMGGRYYLLGSWGVDRVGQARYRVADKPEGPWHKPEQERVSLRVSRRGMPHFFAEFDDRFFRFLACWVSNVTISQSLKVRATSNAVSPYPFFNAGFAPFANKARTRTTS